MIGKKVFVLVLLILLTGTSNLFALAGIGFMGSYDLTFSSDSVNKSISIAQIDTLIARQVVILNVAPGGLGDALQLKYDADLKPSLSIESMTNLFGLGGKIYIDAIPVIDIEAAFFISGNKYDFKVNYPDLKALSDIASGGVSVANIANIQDTSFDGLGIFSRIATDITIRYPLLKFPPVVNIFKLYVGAGPSFVLQTPLINEELVNEILNPFIEEAMSGSLGASPSPTDLADALIDQAKKLELKTGGHLLLGMHIKPPIFPMGLIIDSRFHFGLPTDDDMPGTSFSINAGLSIGF